MPTLLHLDASPRRRSISRDIGAAFADSWRATAPNGHYIHRDLAADPVPFIDAAWTEICDAVLAAGGTDLAALPTLVRTPAQAAAWRIIEPLLAELLAADVVLIGTPMYNYSIPAALKAWLDQVTFPRMSLAPRRFVVAPAPPPPPTPPPPHTTDPLSEEKFAAVHGLLQLLRTAEPNP
ncbi:FMN-dependent NADH-azoreductase [Nocardia farcinica]|uniref:FMN-dependent NADH-azoreductase n=1 Tax=Nocardia farcinica TaxID=37329 RepID=UPI0024590D71|nr:NAD(P)H-dependent oxidoreductase [Nocardia farcinica]